MFDLEGQCNNDPVEGHFIQKGLLKLIQDSTRRVVSFYTFQFTNWEALSLEYALSHLLSPNEAATRKFLCAEHEKFFWSTENPAPDWDNPDHKAKLAYRACLINRYMKEWFIGFGSGDPHLVWVSLTLREQLLHARPLEATIREYLNGAHHGRLRHEVTRIPGQPVIAALGVIFHPLIGSSIADNWSRRVVMSLHSSPIVVTLLPSKGEQLVMFSYASDGVFDAKDLVNALRYQDGSINTAKLSKKLIEEMEFIHMSPGAWASLGRRKREFITKYWYRNFGTSETDLDISPSRVDLFGATNRR